MFKPVVDIDVSKFKSDICVLSPDNQVIRRMQITNDFKGMNTSLSFFLSVEKKYDDRPVIILEATSHYHQLLTNFYQKHDFDQDEILQLIQDSSHKSISYASKKYNAIYELALKHKEIYMCKMSTGVLIETTATIILTLIEAMKQIDDEIHKIIENNSQFASQVSLLESIPGIAEYTAATLLSEIGNIQNFKRGKELVAFFGMDPSVSQSGTYNKKDNKISKRGSPHVRKIPHTLAKNNVFNTCNGKCRNPVLQKYYNTKIQDKPYKVVMCSVMRKLINIIFAVLRDQKPFELRTPEDHEKLIRLKSKMAT